ncbi:hypothetical protein M3_0019 [Lysinibacillus phage vB_LfM_LysYB1]|nr:hypothetical protein M3_0019 [Lysinibacillus phage vB_LfM_LysYB1]WAB25238.1 hypothetical protein M5_0060 [Lysinibacillus phage vB_LfM_LysYB2]
MPNMRKCNHSGAIIFDLTPEEQDVKDMKAEMEVMKEQLASLLKANEPKTKTTKKTLGE